MLKLYVGSNNSFNLVEKNQVFEIANTLNSR